MYTETHNVSFLMTFLRRSINTISLGCETFGMDHYVLAACVVIRAISISEIGVYTLDQKDKKDSLV